MIVSSLNKFILDLPLYIPFSQIKHWQVPEEQGVLRLVLLNVQWLVTDL